MTHPLDMDWRWGTSNSNRRLTAHNPGDGRCDQDGGLMHATVARDGMADIVVSGEVMAAISATPKLYRVLKSIIGDDVRRTIKENHKDECGCNYCLGIAALEQAEGKTP